MLRTTLLFASLILLLARCGTTVADQAATAAQTAVVRTVKEVAISSGAPVTTADLTIQGMSCEMMCGGSIKKALAKLPGVNGTEITFQEGDAADHAIVTYDAAQVDDVALVQAVQALYDGQYKVTEVAITKQVKAVSAIGDDGAEGAARGGVKSYSSAPGSAVLPSVVALLTRILRR